METIALSDVVKHTRLSQCHSCNSHEYRVPFPISAKIELFINCFGALKFPLDKVKIIKLENEHIQIMSRIDSSSIKVKFKKDPKQRELFETQLAAYLSQEMNVNVKNSGLL